MWRVPGLGGPVEIAFDDHGVPHLDASCEADLARAQGLVQGLERPFQLDLLRTALGGRLAAWFGDRPADGVPLPPFGTSRRLSDVDLLSRVIGLERAARASFSVHREATRHLLEAFADGVNVAFAPGAPRGRSVEHRLVRRRPAPWTPFDSLLIVKGMALGLGFAWRGVPVFAAIAERLADAPEHLRAILPREPEPDSPALVRAIVDGMSMVRGFLPGFTAAVGSNAIVVGAERSATGAPLVASDPHLELGMPGVWHLASLASPTFRGVGASLVGLPGIVIGRTEHLAWGLTNAMLDDGDLWLERLDARGERYRLDGTHEPLQIESTTIERRGASPRVARIRRTHRGPLLSDVFPGMEATALSLRLVLHEPAPDLDGFLALGRARSVAEALDAFDGFGSPAQNLVVADVHGDAAYRLIGRVPKRAPGRVPGLPLDGTTRASDWLGMVPETETPRLVLPRDAVFVTANDPIVAPPYPHALSHLYEPDHRAARLRERLARSASIGPDDLAAAQRDVFDRSLMRLRRSLLDEHAEEARRQRPHLAPLIDRLMAWDGEEEASSRGAVLAHLLYHHLIRHVFGARLPRDVLDAWMAQVNLVDTALHRALEDPQSPWAPPASRAGFLARALEDVDRDLHARGFGTDVAWGAWHTLTLAHPLGAVPGLRAFVERGPHPARGGPFTPCSGQYSHARPGPMRVGPSYRQIVDLSARDGGRMVTVAGESGHPASPHYDDQIPLWLDGGWLPMRLDAPSRARRRWRLTP